MNQTYILNIDDIPVKEAHKLDLNKLSAFLIGKLKKFSGFPIIISIPKGSALVFKTDNV